MGTLNLERLRMMSRTRRRAFRFGCPFFLTASFQVPDRIRLGGRKVDLVLPRHEEGVKVAFMELLLCDCYGLLGSGPDIRTIVDIGANVGLFCVAARSAFPDARIQAYEPNRALQPYLSNQASQTGAEVFWEAVTREGGSVLVRPDLADSVNTFVVPSADGDVPAATFREVVRRAGGHIDLLKIDCEGGEWDFLTPDPVWASVDRVSMEYHEVAGHSADDAVAAIERLGFRIIRFGRGPGFGLILAGR